jgi:hypothetical protein
LAGGPAVEEDLVRCMQEASTKFTPLPTRSRSYAEVAAKTPAVLQTCRYVYIRRDGLGHALAAKYDGPYSVLVAGPKYF